MPTFYVATTGNDTTGDGSVGNPYATPSKAHSVAADGDTIEIADGTYVEASYITFNKAVTFHGASKLGTIIESLNGSRIFYFNNSKVRVVSNLTLRNTSAVGGPAYLAQSAGASLNLTTTFSNVYLNNGRTTTIILGAGDYGITLSACSISVSISTLSSILDVNAPAGSITVDGCDITVTSGANASMNGLFRQSAKATAGKLTITDNTFSIDKGVYTIRFPLGGFEDADVSRNTFSVISAAFTRPVILLTDFKTVGVCSDNIITISATTATSIPIQIQSTGEVCVWTLEDNIVTTNNPDSYGILLGGESNAQSIIGAFDGSIVRGNEVYGSARSNAALIGQCHGIMIGTNKNIIFEDNLVQGCGYGAVLKISASEGDDTWTSGYLKNNKFINCTYPFRNKGNKNVKFVNNLIYDDVGITNTAFAITENGSGELASGALLRNNVIVLLVSGKVFNFTDATYATLDSDRNCVYLGGTATIGTKFPTVDYDTLQEWKDGTNQDRNSLYLNPLIDSNYDISQTYLFDFGVPVNDAHDASVIDEAGGSSAALSGGAKFSDQVYARRRVPIS